MTHPALQFLLSNQMLSRMSKALPLINLPSNRKSTIVYSNILPDPVTVSTEYVRTEAQTAFHLCGSRCLQFCVLLMLVSKFGAGSSGTERIREPTEINSAQQQTGASRVNRWPTLITAQISSSSTSTQQQPFT